MIYVIFFLHAGTIQLVVEVGQRNTKSIHLCVVKRFAPSGTFSRSTQANNVRYSIIFHHDMHDVGMYTLKIVGNHANSLKIPFEFHSRNVNVLNVVSSRSTTPINDKFLMNFEKFTHKFENIFNFPNHSTNFFKLIFAITNTTCLSKCSLTLLIRLNKITLRKSI